MVEAQGTAPWSNPVITCAFMFIVPRDTINVGERGHNFNGFHHHRPQMRYDLAGALFWD